MHLKIIIKQKNAGIWEKKLKEFHFYDLTKEDCEELKNLIYCREIFDDNNYADFLIIGCTKGEK
jgi:hypothetical protein